MKGSWEEKDEMWVKEPMAGTGNNVLQQQASVSTDQRLNSAPNQAPSQIDKHAYVCTHRSAIITYTQSNTLQLINV